MTAQLFRNQGDGFFVDASAIAGDYFQKAILGRGMAAGDLDRDGRIDAVVSQQIDPSVILQKLTFSTGNSWVLKLLGKTCCRTPVGTRVTVKNA